MITHCKGCVCPDCGGPMRVMGFGAKLPDELETIPLARRKNRIEFLSDGVCVLDERQLFLLCVLRISIRGNPPGSYFNWHLWAAVPDCTLLNYARKRARNRVVSGHIANNVPLYPGLLNHPVYIRLTSKRRRPLLFFERGSQHPMAIEQRDGIDEARHREIVEQLLAWTSR